MTTQTLKTAETAIYLRVSSTGQRFAAQESDLQQWAESQASPVAWYSDKASGKTMDRPGWNELEADIARGKVKRLVVWRLDRLGRTNSGLSRLFEWLQARGVQLVSLRDGISGLDTPAGRMIATVLAGLAVFETEVRAERQIAGIAETKARGVSRKGKPNPYRGRKPGSYKAGETGPARAAELHQIGLKPAEIAQALGISLRTVHRYLKGARR